MNVIKVTLGFLELAFALKFLSVADLAYGWRILDRETFLALWIVIFGLMGLYLLGKIKFPHDGDENRVGVGRFFLALVSLAFAVYMIPGLWGAPLKAVSAFAPPVMTQDFNLYSNEVHPKFKDYEIGMEYARQQGMPVMVDFTGYGIGNHFIEADAVLGVRAGNALIGIDCNKLPVCPFLNVLGVAIYLCSIRGLLLLRIRGNSGIGCHSAFLHLGFR